MLLACLSSAASLHCVTLDDASTERSWAGAQEIVDGGAVNAEVAMDAAGNAVVVWAEADNQVLSSRYAEVDQGWSSKEQINNHGGRVEKDSLSVSMNRQGAALSVWSEAFGQ
jgi:hypothetical protein